MEKAATLEDGGGGTARTTEPVSHLGKGYQRVVFTPNAHVSTFRTRCFRGPWAPDSCLSVSRKRPPSLTELQQLSRSFCRNPSPLNVIVHTDRFDNIAKFGTRYEITGLEIWDQTGRNAFVYATDTNATLARVGKLLKGRAVFGVCRNCICRVGGTEREYCQFIILERTRRWASSL